jgi:hypothetical protein
MQRRSLFLALFAAAGLALPGEAGAQTRTPARPPRGETAEQRRRRLAEERRRRRLAERQRRQQAARQRRRTQG